MLIFVETGKKKKKNLVVFVHGLTGDGMTWVNDKGQSFADLLLQNGQIKKKFDFSHFLYFSKFYSLRNVKSIRNFFSRNNKAAEINLDVEQITNLFLTELQLKAGSYETITLIGHSLGGLIAKSLILKVLEENLQIKIVKFISLAVPHDGALLSLIAQHLTPNAHIKDLKPLGETVNTLNDKWLKADYESLPETLYFIGSYDTIVSKNSAIAYETKKQEALYFEADHITISKPASSNSSIYLGVEAALLKTMDKQAVEESLTLKELENDEQFNDENFVLKLIIADVHHKTIKTAKNFFYNAEFFRKVVTSKKILTESEFQQLYNLIESLYNNAFSLMTAGTIKSSEELVAHIHNKIADEDQRKLQTISAISFVHKSGMLHQLANTLQKDIWWKDGHCAADLDDARNKNNK